MAIDRTAFNALVDDDGSGTTGTPWEKARIAGVILDPVDAALALSTYTQNFWTPAIVPVGGGVPSYTSRTGFYGLIGKICVVNFSIVFSVGTMSGGISISLPFASVGVGTTVGGIDIPWFGGLVMPVSRLGTVIGSSTSLATIVYVAAAGATGIGYFEAGHLGAGACEFKGGGAYLVG
jgi:hypothetical protein